MAYPSPIHTYTKYRKIYDELSFPVQTIWKMEKKSVDGFSYIFFYYLSYLRVEFPSHVQSVLSRENKLGIISFILANKNRGVDLVSIGKLTFYTVVFAVHQIFFW